MRRANFIVGFNNWGKTTLMFQLFGKERYAYHLTHHLTSIAYPPGFMVQTLSNKYVGQNLAAEIERRLYETKHIVPSPDLFSSLCPSTEPRKKMDTHNNFIEILSDPIFKVFDEFNFFLMLNKWDHHAQLNPTNIIDTYNNLYPNSNFYVIDDTNIPVEQRLNYRLQQVQQILKTKYQAKNAYTEVDANFAMAQ